MQRFSSSMPRACWIRGAALLPLALGALVSPVFPAHAEDHAAPEGSLIYLREVPLRRAYLPGEPGPVHFVRTGPTEEILSGLSTSSTPLSDEEVAAVVASTNAPRDEALASSADILGSSLDHRTAFGAAPAAQGASLEGLIGSSIGQATGAIGSVMSSLSSLMPKTGGQ